MRGEMRCVNLPEAVRYAEDDCSYDLKKALDGHLHWCELCAEKIRKLRAKKESDPKWERWREKVTLKWWHKHAFNGCNSSKKGQNRVMKDPKISIEGDTLNVNGLPIKIVEQEEIDNAAVQGDMTFVCVPCKWGLSMVPGSTKAICGNCNEEVWISPATKASHPIEAPIRCIPCITQEIKQHDAV